MCLKTVPQKKVCVCEMRPITTHLRYWLLKERRDFVIWMVKYPLQQAVQKAGKLIPEPTLENTFHPNSHKFIKIRDRFLEYEANFFRTKLFVAMFNILIGIYEHDVYYRDRIDWLIEVIKEVKFSPRMINHPARQHWREHRREYVKLKGVPIA